MPSARLAILAALAAAAPPSTPPIAIFREGGFPARGAPSSPEALAGIFREAGLEVRFLDARELSDPEALRPERVPLLVLPYGRSFPASAREPFRAYLRAGGRFISLGGYAFLEPQVLEGGRWIPEETHLAARLEDAVRPERSILSDPGFEREETAGAPVGAAEPDARWRRTSAEACRASAAGPRAGERCAEVSLGTPGSAEWSAAIRPEPGRSYRARAWVRTEDLRGRGYAYAAVYQFAADGRLVAFRDFAQVRGTSPWTRHELDVAPAPGVERLAFKAGIYDAAGAVWFDDCVLADVTGLRPVPMTTATGVPADGLEVRPEQIGLFDADYRLRRVARLAAAPGQGIFPELSVEGAFRGWSATCVRGDDATRWVSLLDAVDRYGRLRGSAGSLVLHYGGRWAGSAWAAFGIESADLFDGARPEVARGLARLAKFLLRGLWLAKLEPALAAYEPGGGATVAALVENRGREPIRAEIEIRLVGTGASRLRKLALEPGARIRVEEALPVPSGARGIVRFAAVLRSGGEEVDRAESAFVALAPPRPSAPLRFRENYFSFGDRTIFLFGSDAYANVYTSSAQGPIVWDQELAAARDHGFEIYENLGYSKPGRVFAEEDWSRFRGMALLAQEHGLVFMPGLLIAENVAVSDAEIAAESRQCREFAARLRDIPKLFWYVNGDYALRHDDLPALRAKWAAFLEARYGTVERLEEAWSRSPPFGEGFAGVPFPPPIDPRWDSVAAADLARFHLQLVRSWNAAHVAAIRSEEPARPITSEYYQEPFSGIDLRLTIDGLDVSNIGYFDEPGRDIELLPLRLRWNDLRSVGKSVGLGEYGVKTHPAWTVANGATGYHIARSEDEGRRLFLAVAHIALGMGASRVQNWCLRDSDERVFPWGVFYPGPLVPKDVAYVHRNLSLLFRLFEPRYEPPALTVLLPDGLRVGNEGRLGVSSAYRAFEALLALGADCNVLGDSEADRIPEATRAVIYPAALSASDGSWEAVARWVEAGGKLLVSGGPIHDEDRKLRRAGRLERALGLRFAGRRYSPEERRRRIGARVEPAPGSAFPAVRLDPIARWEPDGADVLAAASGAGGLGPDPRPRVLAARRALGRGRVSFVADPLELAEDEGALEDLRRIYGWFLEAEGLSPRPAAAAGPDLHVFAQATRGGRVHVLFSRRKLAGGKDRAGAREVALRTAAGEIALGVLDGHPALAAVSDSGAVTALEAFGRALIAGEPAFEADLLVAVASLDGLDVRRSGALLLLPFGSGRVAIDSGRAWKSPRALFGDFERGRFRALEVLSLETPRREGASESARLELEIDADRATLVALVAEKDEAEKIGSVLGLARIFFRLENK